MPATYTYNDGIEDAKREIVHAWEEAGEPFQAHMAMVRKGRDFPGFERKEITMAKHEELAWIPMCVPEKGTPWFFHAGVRDLQRDARNDFAKHCCMEWEALRIEGWRIVRVRLSYHS